MITITSALDFPSMKKFAHLYDAFGSPEYNVFGYLSNSKGEIYNAFGILNRLQLLKHIVENGNQPFYGADLFGANASLGGWMNGLSVWGIIKETGNVREYMVQIDGDLYRKCEVKEWKSAIDVDYLRILVDEFRSALIDQI